MKNKIDLIKKNKNQYYIVLYFFLLIIISVFLIGLFNDSRENGYINVSSLNELPQEIKEIWFQVLTFSLGIFYGANFIIIFLERKKRLHCIMILLTSFIVIGAFPYLITFRPETFAIGLIISAFYSYKTRGKQGEFGLYEKSVKIIGFLAMFSVWVSLANYVLGNYNLNTAVRYFWLALIFSWVFIKFSKYEIKTSRVFVVGPRGAGKTVFMCALYKCAEQQNKNLGVISEDLSSSLSEIYDGNWPSETLFNKSYEFSYEHGVLFVKDVTISALDFRGQSLEDEINMVVQYIKNKRSDSTIKPRDPTEEVADGIYNASKLFFIIDGARIGLRRELGDFIQKYYFKILRELPKKPYCIVITKSDIFIENEGVKTEDNYENFKTYMLKETCLREPFFKQIEKGASGCFPIAFLSKDNKPWLKDDNTFNTKGFDKILEEMGK